MRVFFVLTVAAVFLTGIAGCAGLHSAGQVGNNAGSAVLTPYSGPKVTIAVADFDVKSAKTYGEIGPGLREIFVAALVDSKRFSVVERQALGAVIQEQDSAASDAVQQGGAAQKGKIKTADIIITAAVAEFEPRASGGSGGIGGGGSAASGMLGGVLGASMNKAHMALDIRIVNSSTSEVLASERVQGQANDVAGGFMTGFFGGSGLGGGLSMYANTPMEKAVRICIVNGVEYIAQNIPAEYYKH